MGRTKINKLQSPSEQKSTNVSPSERDIFVRETSVALLKEIVGHSGKCHPDQVTVVVERANAMADLLGMGGKKPEKKKPVALINLVEAMESEPDLD